MRRALRTFAATRPGSWLFARVLDHIDRPVFRLTRGRRTMTSLLAGLPVVMLTTTGARSGQQRTVPLVGLTSTEGLAVIASSYGQRSHPAWYHNLRANPRAEVTVDGVRRACVAVVAEGDRRARIWQQALAVYPGFGRYELRASHRDIPVFVLEPDDAPTPS
jgi:deazaflavin-dependent oxidoreductase (nitroreductase family)